MAALRGRRVLVTRAAGQASVLAEALRAEGAEVLVVPAIEIAPPQSFCALDAALTTVRAYDWVVFTSANAVEAFAARAQRLRLPMAARRVAVIGPSTAQAAIARGVAGEVALQPARFVAEALLEAMLPEVQGSAVLLVRAAEGRDVLVDGLRAGGAEVTVATAYRTVVPESSVALLREAFGPGGAAPDVATFTSGSGVTNLDRLLDEAGVPGTSGMILASIGPITSAAMRDVGWTVDVEAREATIAGLVAALVDYVLVRRPGLIG